jgi:hypothetical protein
LKEVRGYACVVTWRGRKRISVFGPNVHPKPHEVHYKEVEDNGFVPFALSDPGSKMPLNPELLVVFGELKARKLKDRTIARIELAKVRIRIVEDDADVAVFNGFSNYDIEVEILRRPQKTVTP